MQKLLVGGLFVFSVIASAAGGDAELINTSGKGRYVKSTNYLLFAVDKSYQAVIPEVVKTGQHISVHYQDDDITKTDEFVVTRISTKDNLCRLHNKVNSSDDIWPGNVIYIKPCLILER